MRKLAVGDQCVGRIINIYDGSFVVSLEDDYVGKIINGALKTSIGIGTCVDVIVSGIDTKGITLDLISVHEESSVDKSNAISPWGNWDSIPTGHHQAIVAMFNLRNRADKTRKQLSSLRKELNLDIEDNAKEYDSVLKKINIDLEKERKRLYSNCESDVNRISKFGGYFISKVTSYCETFKDDISKSGISDALQAYNNGLSIINSKERDVLAAANAEVNARQQLYYCQVADLDRTRNERINVAKQQQLDKDKTAQRRFNTRYNNICESFKNDVNIGFNKSTIHAYQQRIKSSGFNVVNYECPTEVPEFVMLGSLGLSFPNKIKDDFQIIQTINLQTSDISEKKDDEYTVRIPYTQSLADGISLLMRYTPIDKRRALEIIQPLLMKLFMSFPAGKLEATMIDPLELGASFPDIPEFAKGHNISRVINTKIWSKEKDIENVISSLRQDLENLTQAYGEDYSSRLKKETIRALAITDFPVGFSDSALKDLHAIVRKSASLGVCVFICANEDELEKLRRKNPSLVAEITQSVIDTRISGDRLAFTNADYERMFLEIDTMQEAFENKQRIIPLIRDAIEHMPTKIEQFDSMFAEDIHDCNNWFSGNYNEIAIPIGIKGANTVVKMIMGRGGGNTEHHALITGITGAGKSTFFHTLIMSTLISYSPDEVQMYLLDFKEGVEFSAYTRYRLPSIRIVAINSEREYGLSVLRELNEELENRAEYFQRSVGTTEINDYLNKPDLPKIPKLMLVFDEVQELFRSREDSDSISSECISLIKRLVTQGRAVGIHVILACQDFNNCPGLESCFSQMAIRIAIKGSAEGAASILEAGNSGVYSLRDKPAGTAIYNSENGLECANTFFQVSLINETERMKLLEELDAYFTDPIIASLYENNQTRILLTNAENDIHNCFNKLILQGVDSVKPLGSTQDGYGMLLGQSFGRKSMFIPELRLKDGDNLLVVTKEEKMAMSLFEYAMMSVLYEELHTHADKTNALVYLIDLSDERLQLLNDACDFDYFESQFSQQVRVVKKGDADHLLSDLYNTVVMRSEGRSPATERVFLMFFGINRAKGLRNDRIYEQDHGDEISPIEKLKKILTYGPRYGVNSIVWGESVGSISNVLGESYERVFDKRIAYKLDERTMEMLVDEVDAKSIQGKVAVYMDYRNDNKNTHFRLYDVPAKIWIKRYAETYDRVIKGD